jgi:hypothetical protein
MKHKHYEIIMAWAEGNPIQLWRADGWQDWTSKAAPAFNPSFEYRVKPMPKRDIVKSFYLESNPLVGHRFSEAYTDNDLLNKHSCIKCTFDGETTKLKWVEVLK